MLPLNEGDFLDFIYNYFKAEYAPIRSFWSTATADPRQPQRWVNMVRLLSQRLQHIKQLTDASSRVMNSNLLTSAQQTHKHKKTSSLWITLHGNGVWTLGLCAVS